MKKYLGVKIVGAEPAQRGWNDEESKQISAERLEPGYKVVYEDGYASWSPKEVFEKAYKCIEGLEENLDLSVNTSTGEWHVDCPILDESSRASQPESLSRIDLLKIKSLELAIAVSAGKADYKITILAEEYLDFLIKE